MCSRIDTHPHVAPHSGSSPIAKVKKLTGGLGLGFDLWSSDLKIYACRCPTIYYMSTDFSADSSSRFPCRARTNRQTDKRTDIRDWYERPTQAGGYTLEFYTGAGVGMSRGSPAGFPAGSGLEFRKIPRYKRERDCKLRGSRGSGINFRGTPVGTGSRPHGEFT